jgi:hypothetical protein
MGLAMIFKLGPMPYDMVERSMTAFGDEVMPRIRDVLDRNEAVGAGVIRRGSRAEIAHGGSFRNYYAG